MITSLVVSLVLGQSGFTCAVMTAGSASLDAKSAMDFAGTRYPFCCAGCEGAFSKEPAKFTKAPTGKTIGFSLFNPVTGMKVDLKKVKELQTTDFGGVRYFLANEEQVAQFKADAKNLTKVPEKEALFCPVMGHGVKGYNEAGAMADHNGVRYYLCCGDCLAEFKKQPDTYAEKAKASVAAPKAVKVQAPK